MIPNQPPTPKIRKTIVRISIDTSYHHPRQGSNDSKHRLHLVGFLSPSARVPGENSHHLDQRICIRLRTQAYILVPCPICNHLRKAQLSDLIRFRSSTPVYQSLAPGRTTHSSLYIPSRHSSFFFIVFIIVTEYCYQDGQGD